MRRVRHGPVMVAGEEGSVPATAHSALCMQMPSLAAFKMLSAHARIQAFRRLRARFFDRASRAGRWATSTGHDAQYIKSWRDAAHKKLAQMLAMSGRRCC